MTVMEVGVLAVVMMEVVAPNGNGRQVTALNYIIFIQLIVSKMLMIYTLLFL